MLSEKFNLGSFFQIAFFSLLPCSRNSTQRHSAASRNQNLNRRARRRIGKKMEAKIWEPEIFLPPFFGLPSWFCQARNCQGNKGQGNKGNALSFPHSPDNHSPETSSPKWMTFYYCTAEKKLCQKWKDFAICTAKTQIRTNYEKTLPSVQVSVLTIDTNSGKSVNSEDWHLRWHLRRALPLQQCIIARNWPL